MSQTRDELISIQFLRGLAAFLVMFAHAQSETVQKFGAAAYRQIDLPGGFGVDIFFVISGFIMVYASQGLFGQPGAAREFMKRRVVRIVPLYWFYTTAMVAATLLFADRLNSAEFEPYNAIMSYLFVPAMAPKGEIAPILDLGWTLNYEMFFYVVFACAIGLPIRRAVIAVIAAICLIAAAGFVFPMPFDVLIFWTNSIIIEFVLGCALGYYYIGQGRRDNAGIFLMAVGAGLVWYYLGHYDYLMGDRFFDRGISAALLVYGFVFHMPAWMEDPVKPVAKWVGDSSYSLYLSHPFALAIVAMAWPRSLSIPVLYLVVAAGAAVLGGILSYLIVERPVTAWLKRRANGGRAATGPALAPS